MPATVVSDTTTTGADSSVTRSIVYSDGSRSVQFTPGPGTPAANADSIQVKAIAALATNTTFLALNSPTTAQVTAQVKALTRETTALIRLLLDQLDDTAGT